MSGVAALVEAGTLTDDSMVWYEGCEDWVRFGDCRQHWLWEPAPAVGELPGSTDVKSVAAAAEAEAAAVAVSSSHREDWAQSVWGGSGGGSRVSELSRAEAAWKRGSSLEWGGDGGSGSGAALPSSWLPGLVVRSSCCAVFDVRVLGCLWWWWHRWCW
eukprot:COSAG01_NODE_3554_length_5940_cov_77.779319_8_plen_158_part_00